MMNAIFILMSIVAILSIVIGVILITEIYIMVTIEHPTPYHLETENKSSEPQTAVLFGVNKYLLTSNFGSAIPIVVSSNPNVPYLQHLSQSGQNPFETRLIRLRGNIDDLSKMVINVNSSDANGQSCQIPIFVNNYVFPDDYIKAKDLTNFDLDIPYRFVIDGNTNLDYEMNPNSKISMDIFYNTVEFRKMKLYKYIQIKVFGKSYSENHKRTFAHPLNFK